MGEKSFKCLNFYCWNIYYKSNYHLNFFNKKSCKDQNWFQQFWLCLGFEEKLWILDEKGYAPRNFFPFLGSTKLINATGEIYHNTKLNVAMSLKIEKYFIQEQKFIILYYIEQMTCPNFFYTNGLCWSKILQWFFLVLSLR